jgi:hypothetical protein
MGMKRKAPASRKTLRAQLEALGARPVVTGREKPERLEAVLLSAAAWDKRRATIIERAFRRPELLDAEDWQEVHSPTTLVAANDPEVTKSIRRNMTRIRQAEAWRQNMLSPLQQSAERELSAAYQARVQGTGAKAAKLMRVSPGRSYESHTPYAATLDATFRAWVVDCRRRIGTGGKGRKRRNALSVIFDILTEPLTLRDVERRHNLGQGEAFSLYLQGLDLWCGLRGWLAFSGKPRAEGLDDAE